MLTDKVRKLGRACLGAALVLFAADAYANSLTNAIAAARGELQDHFAAKTPGYSVAVGRNGKVLWAEGFGFADLANHKPVTTQTEFRIGSVSKPITAAGLMLLVEQGRIDLDVDIHQYIPDFADKGATITTRQLAGHLAGIRHYRGDESESNFHYESLRAGLKIFEADPLLSPPGEKYSYSSYGFNLIGAEMEAVTHEKFADYMRKAVLTPLHMDHTFAEDPAHEPPDCGCFYVPDDGKNHFVLAPPVDNAFKLPSGGFISTPADLVQFGSAMLHPGLLQSASLKTMFVSQKTKNGKSTGYGIGWDVGRTSDGHRVWTHAGSAVGGMAELLVFPDEGLVIAAAFNSSEVFDKNVGKIFHAIADDFAGVTP